MPVMTTTKVNELSSFPTESLRSPTLHCIEGAFMFSKRCRIVVEVLKHWEHKVGVFQDERTPFFLSKDVGGHRHRLRVGVGPVPKSFPVSDLRQFSYISAKKSFPTPLSTFFCKDKYLFF